MTIYTATYNDHETGEPCFAVSLDDEKWLPANRLPEATVEDYAAITAMFASQKTTRNGRPTSFTPMTIGKRAFKLPGYRIVKEPATFGQLEVKPAYTNTDA